MELTERDDDGAGDAVGHDHREDAHHPGVGRTELELKGLVLWTQAGHLLTKAFPCQWPIVLVTNGVYFTGPLKSRSQIDLLRQHELVLVYFFLSHKTW